ncbi:MAG: hypothetical protein NTY67_15750 [Cyanobacteria bacterium]|nr:hypothetical protein [Cyanobacteriota bacterium]
MTILNSGDQRRPEATVAGAAERALVLVGFGLAGAPPPAAMLPAAMLPAAMPPLPAVAQRLAALLELPIHRLSPPGDPNAALAALAAACAALPVLAPGPGGLGLLEIDPGLSLPAGGSWVEALGAWRQPCVLVIAADQLGCGWPAAGTALLQRWGVPLLGLLQWGGAWDGPARRRDALPWLGLAADPGVSWAGERGAGGDDSAEPEAPLVLVLKRRWQQLDLH